MKVEKSLQENKNTIKSSAGSCHKVKIWQKSDTELDVIP